MKTLFLVSALLIGSPSFAGDWSYKYLQKLYHKDAEKCYERCQTIMDLFPGQESAWFFAMKIETERLATASKEKTKSAKLNRAVDYARYFDQHASPEMKQLTQWDTVQPWLQAISLRVREELDNAGLDVNIRQLDERWKKYTGNALKPKSRTENKQPVKTPAATFIPVTTETANVSAKPFFGMPTGQENIVSANPKGEKELLILINKERKRLKMDTLIWNPDLARACRYHAMDMGIQGYFDHNSYDNVNGQLVEVGGTFERIRKFYHASFVNSENIAAGNSTAAGTYQQWFTSPGHYANMFNPDSKYVGIGTVNAGERYGSYWVFCTAQ